MIYGYKRPSGTTFSLSGGDSPSWETDIRLDNGQPAEQTVIGGIATSSPSTSEYVDIRMDWAVPQGISTVGILRVSCPVGTNIVVTGRRVGDGGYTRDLGGNSDYTVSSVEGLRRMVVVTDSTETDYIGIQVRVYNDTGGVTWADNTTYLYIGEIAVHEGTRICAQPLRRSGRTTRSIRDRASNGALHIYPRGEYRSESITVMGTIEESYEGGLDNGVDIAKLRVMQDEKRYRAMIVPRGVNDYASGPNYNLIQQKALFCAVTWGQITEEEAKMRFSATLDCEEAV